MSLCPNCAVRDQDPASPNGWCLVCDRQPTLVVEPRPRRRRRRSPLAELLTQVATEHPDEDVRIRAYETNEAARVACYKLRAGIRAPHSRPEGRWEFFYGDIADSPRFGVWAHFYPPAPAPAPDTD